MNQYIHLLSNSGVGLPTDLWVPATQSVKPQNSKQVAAGIAKDFEKQKFSVTLEGYYKEMDNIIAYKEGALSFLAIEDNVDDASLSNRFHGKKILQVVRGLVMVASF